MTIVTRRPRSPIGFGSTEAEAVADLLMQLHEDEEAAQ